MIENLQVFMIPLFPTGGVRTNKCNINRADLEVHEIHS